MISYIYDASDNVIGIKYNDNIYYYEKNIQNDITGIMDDSFNLLATYEYDSWGNIKSIKDTAGNTITDSTNIALVNPFRYRSYYYDSEIGMYYLNSRYYNSEFGRFINADNILAQTKSLIGNNMYIYCESNPINCIDSTGKFGINLVNINKFITDTYTRIAMHLGVKATSAIAGKPLAGEMFSNSLSGNKTTNLPLNQQKKIAQQVPKTIQFKSLIDNVIKSSNGKNFNTGMTSIEFSTGDLHYSIQKANIQLSGKKSESGWYIDVYMEDLYNFDEYREGASFSNIMNNFGYNLQHRGILTPYDWNTSFSLKY